MTAAPKLVPPGAPKKLKATHDAIAVENPPATQDNEVAANCFAKSKVTPRTPPQITTTPVLEPDKPEKQHKAVNFIDSESDSDSELDNKDMTHSSSDATCHSSGTLPREPGTIVQALRQAMNKLAKQKTSGSCLAIKTEVMADLDCIIQKLLVAEKNSAAISEVKPQDAAGTDRITAIENDLHEIKTAIKEMLTVEKGKKSWAQVAAQPGTPTQEKVPEILRREHLEKHRMEKAKREVVITMHGASEKIKNMLAGLDEEGIAKGIREMIGTAGVRPSAIQSVMKTINHGLRICCPSEKEAEELRKLDWAQAFEGAALVEPQFTVVIHGVPKEYIDFERDTPEEINAKIEKSNNYALRVVRAGPLRKHSRNPNAKAQSIMVSITKPESADECILYGVYIGHIRHSAERYTPQCQIKQCFKCQGYGHKAGICTKAVKCGRCAKDHETKMCSNDVLQCAQCKGPHVAWHYECSARQREHQRLENLKDVISPTFIPRLPDN